MLYHEQHVGLARRNITSSAELSTGPAVSYGSQSHRRPF